MSLNDRLRKLERRRAADTYPDEIAYFPPLVPLPTDDEYDEIERIERERLDGHHPTPSSDDNPATDDDTPPTPYATAWPWVDTESALATYDRVQAAMDARTNGGDA